MGSLWFFERAKVALEVAWVHLLMWIFWVETSMLSSSWIVFYIFCWVFMGGGMWLANLPWIDCLKQCYFLGGCFDFKVLQILFIFVKGLDQWFLSLSQMIILIWRLSKERVFGFRDKILVNKNNYPWELLTIPEFFFSSSSSNGSLWHCQFVQAEVLSCQPICFHEQYVLNKGSILPRMTTLISGWWGWGDCAISPYTAYRVCRGHTLRWKTTSEAHTYRRAIWPSCLPSQSKVSSEACGEPMADVLHFFLPVLLGC